MGKIIDDRDEVNFRNPESFGMYTFNDAAGYGIQEMIENMIVEINKSKVTKDKWIIFTRLVRLILDGEVTGWQSKLFLSLAYRSADSSPLSARGWSSSYRNL